MTIEEDTTTELHMWLSQTADNVKATLSKFEADMVAPAVQHGQTFAQTHPFTATLLATFAFWSALPIACFLGFSFMVAFSFISVALTCASLGAVVIIFLAGFVLAVTLALTLGLSLLLTGFVFVAYLGIRLVHHLRSSDGAGVQGWAIETKGRLWLPSKAPADTTHPKREGSEEWESLKDKTMM